MVNLIYITEDDESIRELVKMALQSFNYEVQTFENAEDTLAASDKLLPSLYIFDIMLPQMDGITAVKRLRENSKTRAIPIIMLTAKDTEYDKVKGLDVGADDYLAKPFGVMELAARIRALLRRSHLSSTQEILSSDDLIINPLTRECLQNNVPLDLTYKEFELLYLLMSEKNRVIPRDELISSLWGEDFVGETRTLDMHIRALRQKLNDDAENPTYIKTVRGVGYRFCE